MMVKYLKWFFIIFVLCVLAIPVGIYLNNKMVERATRDFIYTNTDNIPHNKVGLLLGTSKHSRRGGINLYYKYRIDAAVKLYKAVKIDYILVSGDNGSKTYDEPTSFRDDLIKAGIPEDRIVLDYAGFRTLDSIVRAQEVFGEKNITIISQRFHNERALFIAQRKGMNAVAYDAKNPYGAISKKMKQREYLARSKMMLDLLIGKQPKFLGKKIKIG